MANASKMLGDMIGRSVSWYQLGLMLKCCWQCNSKVLGSNPCMASLLLPPTVWTFHYQVSCDGLVACPLWTPPLTKSLVQRIIRYMEFFLVNKLLKVILNEVASGFITGIKSINEWHQKHHIQICYPTLCWWFDFFTENSETVHKNSFTHSLESTHHQNVLSSV